MATTFSHLSVVVVDEAHVYRGVFGSHVANVLRRLLRIAEAKGSNVHVLLASATIANPIELAERLTGLDDVSLVEKDGSPTPRRQIAMWNPPFTDEAIGARRSALGEAAELLARLVREGTRAICFMKSRKGVELLARMVTEDLKRTDPELAEKVAPYRAGYTSQQRRELEGRLMRGELSAVITTDASRAGDRHRRAGRSGGGHVPRHRRLAAPDVGARGTPRQGTCRLRRRRGRARTSSSAAIPTSSWSGRSRPRSSTTRVRRSTRRTCCARRYEGPLSNRDDAEFFGPRWEAHAEALVSAGLLRKRVAARGGRPRMYPLARRTTRPRKVSLRSSSPDSFAIVDVSSGELLGQTESARAHSTIHGGAIYLHQGRSYEVRELDLEHRRALVAPFDGDWYTQPKRETDTNIERLLDRREALGVTLSFGEVSVTETVLGYQRKRLSDHAQIDLVMLDLPQTSFSTQALWFELDGATLTGLTRDGRTGPSRWMPCSAPCTPPSTPRSRCSP